MFTGLLIFLNKLKGHTVLKRSNNGIPQWLFHHLSLSPAVSLSLSLSLPSLNMLSALLHGLNEDVNALGLGLNISDTHNVDFTEN